MSDQVAVLMRKAPYGSAYSAEGIRSVIGLGAFELDVSLVFVDDGVYVLVKGQDPTEIEAKPLGEAFSRLSDFGVTKLYVHEGSLKERGLKVEDLAVEVEVIDDAGVAEALESNGRVLPF